MIAVLTIAISILAIAISAATIAIGIRTNRRLREIRRSR